MARKVAIIPACGSKHMDPATQALCFFYRNPPAESGVKPQPYKAIAKLIKQPKINTSRLKMAVHRFMVKKAPRGRKAGWRKTTVAEDNLIVSTFYKVRQPLGVLVEAPFSRRTISMALRRHSPQMASAARTC